VTGGDYETTRYRSGRDPVLGPRPSQGVEPNRLERRGEGIAQSPVLTLRPSTTRTDYTQKVRFSATLGEEPEVEVGLV
jgi:hypothetical protein